jgi:uroporphyrinogen-III synthase
MRFIITRPLEDAKALAEKLGSRGDTAVIEPLISIVVRDNALWPDKPYQAIVVSSANAARVLASHNKAPRLFAVQAFAVGRQSAAAARHAGFQTVTAGDGNMAQLAAKLAATLDPRNGPILYLSGEDIAADLETMLKAQRFEVERSVLYKAEAVADLSENVKRRIVAGDIDGVFLYSPRTATIWRSLVEKARLSDKVQPLPHLCLSANVAATLGKDYVKVIAPEPTEPSLLSLLDRMR